MAAILFGTTGMTWGMAEETGVLAQSYERTVSGQEKLIKNAQGEDAALSMYNAEAEHTVEGYLTGETGIAAAAFGTALVIANVLSGGGVSAGLVICTGVTDRRSNEDYRSISATAKQRPLITAAYT